MTRPGKWEPMDKDDRFDWAMDKAFPGCMAVAILLFIAMFGLVCWAIIELVQWVTSK